MGGLVLTPVITLAQTNVSVSTGTNPDLNNIQSLVQSLGSIIDSLIPIVLTLGLLAFFWGLAVFIFSAGDEEKKTKGKNIMFWGIIALFVMVAIWGIVAFISSALGIGVGGTAPTPAVNPNAFQ